MIGLLLVFILLLPGQVHATVFWEDDFENHIYPNWIYAGDGLCSSAGNPDGVGCNPGLSATRAHSGTHALKGTYTGPDSGSFMERSFSGTTDLYERVWMYFDNFSAIQCPNEGCAGTKNILSLGTVTFSTWWMISYDGSEQFYAIVQTPASNPGDVDVLGANVGSGAWPSNQWTCIEFHTKVNTPGQSNGQIEMWVDGVRIMNYPNYNLTASSGSLNLTRYYVQHGLGDIYWDDHAVGDTRIGCAGGGGGGSTAGGGLDF